MNGDGAEGPEPIKAPIVRERSAVDRLQEVSASSTQRLRGMIDQLHHAIGSTTTELAACRLDFEDTAAALRQALDVIRNANVPPPPPAHLQKRVVGGYPAGFMSSGDGTLCDFARILQAAGVDIAGAADVLDFGVGCGRVLRRFAETFPNARLVGVDIDGEAIDWLSAHYAPRFGRFVQLPHVPPSSLAEGTFDLVYAVSVFTHLNEQMQFSWLQELRRVTRVGGHLIITIHGENYVNLFPAEVRERIETEGLFYNEQAGVTPGLPEFYKNTYHTRAYIEREWARYFELVSYEALGCEGHQDLLLFRRTE